MTAVDYYLTVRPDWAGGFEMTRAWRTSIQQAVTGSEKRSAIFSRVRRGFNYKVRLLSAAELAYLKRVLWRDLHLIVGIPVWPDGAALTDQVDAGLDLILPVTSTTDREFEAGAEVILIDADDPDHYEAAAVDYVTATQVVLLDAVAGDWPVHTMVYPVAACRIEPAQTLKALTAGIGEFSVSAAEEIGVWS